jgi:hypothetical protein
MAWMMVGFPKIKVAIEWDAVSQIDRRYFPSKPSTVIGFPLIPDKIAVCIAAQRRHLTEGTLCTQRPLALLLPSPYSSY